MIKHMPIVKKNQYIYHRANNRWQIVIKGKRYGMYSSLEQAIVDRDVILNINGIKPIEPKIKKQKNKKLYSISSLSDNQENVDFLNQKIEDLFSELNNIQMELANSQQNIQNNMVKILNSLEREKKLVIEMSDLNTREKHLINSLI